MSHLSASELLNEAFTAQKLVDIEQNLNLPPISDASFAELLENNTLDFGIALTPQLHKLTIHTTEHEQTGKAPIDTSKSSNYYIPTHIINYCLFIDFYFEILEDKPYFHSKIHEALTELKPVLLKALIFDAKFLQSSSHYLRELLDNIFLEYSVWDDQLGGQSKQLFNRLTHLTASLQTLAGHKALPEIIDKELETLTKIFDFFKKTEHTTCENERKQMAMARSQYTVDHFLDEHLHNKKLPPVIITLLCGTWRNVLIDTLHKRGKNDQTYVKITEFTVDIIEHFCTNRQDDNPSKRLAFIPVIKPTLEKYFPESLRCELTNTILEIENLNRALLNDKIYSTEHAAKLCEDNNPEFINISKAIIQVSSTLPKGQVIILHGKKNGSKRCRIADTYPDLREFLFVDAIGKKSHRKSFVSLGYELLTKRYSIIESSNLFSKIFKKALDRYLKRLDYISKKNDTHETEKITKKQREDALKKATIEAEELKKQKQQLEEQYAAEIEKIRQEQLQEHIRLKQELEELRSSQKIEKKHMEEAQKLKIKNTELEKQLQQESNKNKLISTTEKVRALTIGSWLYITLDDGESIECKIAMIYPSSGKIVFVDKIGRKVAEFMPDILTEKILSGEAEIIKNESSFESSIERVVTSLKR